MDSEPFWFEVVQMANNIDYINTRISIYVKESDLTIKASGQLKVYAQALGISKELLPPDMLTKLDCVTIEFHIN